MRTFSEAQSIEFFHLAFLNSLSVGDGHTAFVLKGGANLRYFFDSQRYSEDIDLDVVRLKAWKLEEKIDRVLRSPLLSRLLRSSGVAIAEFSKPKQTETTQRWKVALEIPDRSEPVRTKIEFSHRRLDERYLLETIPARVVQPYGLRSVAVQHYTQEAALAQKVLALAGRSETQARDVFDLDLLLRQSSVGLRSLDAETLRHAGDRGMELPYGSYRDQVLPFIEPDVLPLCESREFWQEMQTFVAGRLEASVEDN